MRATLSPEALLKRCQRKVACGARRGKETNVLCEGHLHPKHLHKVLFHICVLRDLKKIWDPSIVNATRGGGFSVGDGVVGTVRSFTTWGSRSVTPAQTTVRVGILTLAVQRDNAHRQNASSMRVQVSGVVPRIAQRFALFATTRGLT